MKHLQRLRQNRFMRDLVSEIGFCKAQLIQPLFVVDGIAQDEPIPSLKDNFRLTQDSCLKSIEQDLERGVSQFLLFVVPADRRERGFDKDFGEKTINSISTRFGKDLNLWVDICMCSFTSSGHCCIYDQNGEVDLESSLSELCALATSAASAGANGVSPSDMTDGRTAAIRAALDKSGHYNTPIMSYSTKFASNFYGPFRAAADCAPKFGDRKQYQIDPRNRSDAIASSVRCAEEGADLLMVKPGMTSLDLINPIRQATGKPVGAYHVSGEYGALALLAEKGLVNFEQVLLESWYVLRRAGASYIITYGARLAKNLGL